MPQRAILILQATQLSDKTITKYIKQIKSYLMNILTNILENKTLNNATNPTLLLKKIVTTYPILVRVYIT